MGAFVSKPHHRKRSTSELKGVNTAQEGGEEKFSNLNEKVAGDFITIYDFMTTNNS